MNAKRLALVIPDRVTCTGVQGLIKASHFAHNSLNSFSDFAEMTREINTIDILLMDVSDLSQSQIESRLQRLRYRRPDLMTILIHNQLKTRVIKRALQAGAQGYIYRDDLSHALISSLDAASRGVMSLSQQALTVLTDDQPIVHDQELRPFDHRVLALIAEGRSVKGIATQLKVSPRSVYRSRDKLRTVLGVQNNETLIDAARERGLLDDN